MRDARDMRIVVNDFGGYPFAVELSMELAARGHAVTHCWCASLIDTPLSARDLGDDRRSTAPDFVALDLGSPLDKYHYLRRLRQERRYGRLAAEVVEDVRPDVVLAANVPLDAQRRLLAVSTRYQIPFVFWLQDLIGPATAHLLRERLPIAGRLIGSHYTRLEAKLLRSSAAVVPISDAFAPYLGRCGVDPARVTTVENWAPLADLPVRNKRNAWALRAGLADTFVFGYTGALGMKQDPDLLLALAKHFRGRDGVRVVVHTGGPSLEYLRAKREALGLPNLVVRDFVEWSELPDVLGASDVLVATIHAGAASYSVPSKIMSYLCAGRPLLLSVPHDNLAAQVVGRQHAGMVVAPGDVDGFLESADLLYASSETRSRMAAGARRYAEAAFDIAPIADRFEAVLRGAIAIPVWRSP